MDAVMLGEATPVEKAKRGELLDIVDDAYPDEELRRQRQG